MGNESGGTGIIIFGVGILVGAFATFLILEGREQQAPAAAAQQPQSMDMSADLPRLYVELHRLRIENDELRLKLQIAAPHGWVIPETKPVVMPAASSNRMDRNSAMNPVNPVHPVQTAPQPAPAQVQTYKNTEKWKYEKDKLGRITGLEISREAKRDV